MLSPKQIKKLRTDMGLTQTQFAQKLGVTFVTVNRWENGKTIPQPDRIQRLEDIKKPTIPPLEEFKIVKQLAEDACKKATEQRLPCSSNLGDLHCMEVRWSVDEGGDGLWEVYIEEAAHDDGILRKFIREELNQAGVANVAIDLQW